MVAAQESAGGGRLSIRIIEGQSQYDIFRDWQDALARELTALGVDVSTVPVSRSNEGTPASLEVSLGFNLTRLWSREHSDRRHVAWIVDHPAFHTHLFLPEFSRLPVDSRYCVAGVVDQAWAGFARDLFKYPKVFFLPHASSAGAAVAPDWRDRPSEIVFFGSIRHPEPVAEGLRALAARMCPDCAEEINALIGGAAYPPEGIPPDKRLWEILSGRGRSPGETLMIFSGLFTLLDTYHRNRTRILTLQAIRKHTVHVYGAGPWAEMDLPASIVLHPPVTHRAAIELMRQSRMALNQAPTLKEGAHERVLDALACGCAVLTTPSRYLASEFGPRQGLGFYDPEDGADLDEILDRRLHSASASEEVAAGQERVMQGHTMKARAQSLCDIIRTTWPETQAR